MQRKPKFDLSGKTFGSLRVIRFSCIPRAGWDCICECGNETTIKSQTLRAGKAVSCGCSIARRLSDGLNRKHGAYETPTHNSWTAMMDRCYKEGDIRYKNYGGRGITVCEEWKVFENFKRDMGERPKGMTLDRIDTNGNYDPLNCRWATSKTQANNKTNNRRYNYKGNLLTAAELREFSNVNYATLRNRLRRGWDVETALTMGASHANSGQRGVNQGGT